MSEDNANDQQSSQAANEAVFNEVLKNVDIDPALLAELGEVTNDQYTHKPKFLSRHRAQGDRCDLPAVAQLGYARQVDGFRDFWRLLGPCWLCRFQLERSVALAVQSRTRHPLVWRLVGR